MLKKLLTVLLLTLVIFSICLPSVGFAYGNTMPVQVYSSKQDLIYIKRPESRSASTSDKTYTISAVGSEGLNVAVYKYNPNSNSFYLVKGYTKIGASGLYSTVVDLNEDSNLFRVYATNGNDYQVADITISKIKKSTIDKLKGITVTVRNFFN